MKKILYLVITCAAAGMLVLVGIHILPNPDLQGPGEIPTEVPENRTPRPTGVPRENTSFIEIHHAGDPGVILYPGDPGYPAIEAECREQIRSTCGQYKMGFSRVELAAMKQNAPYVAMHLPAPTRFETGYIVDGSPKEILADEAVFFLDFEDWPENIIIMRLGDVCGVWDASRDREKLRVLADPFLVGRAAS